MASESNENDTDSQIRSKDENQIEETVRIANNNTASEVTEGRDGMALLRKAVSMTTKKCLSAGRFSLFASSFKPLMKKHPQALKKIHQQFLQQLENSIDVEINMLYNEENMVVYMNQLDDLKEKADKEGVAWRPSGNVEDDLRAHLHPLKLKQRDRLKKLEENLEEENRNLRGAVEARRKKFLATEKVILDHVLEIKSVHAATQNVPIMTLESFVKLS